MLPTTGKLTLKMPGKARAAGMKLFAIAGRPSHAHPHCGPDLALSIERFVIAALQLSVGFGRDDRNCVHCRDVLEDRFAVIAFIGKYVFGYFCPTPRKGLKRVLGSWQCEYVYFSHPCGFGFGKQWRGLNALQERLRESKCKNVGDGPSFRTK
jgi:hypothetical protein